jgi:hypothetical protein
MKNILLFCLVFVLAIQTSQAQVYDIDIPSDVLLTDNQWHMQGYSIVEANNDRYLVINPNGYEYYTLKPFDVLYFRAMTGDIVFSFKPCFYQNTLGWFVEGRISNYFVYPYGGYVILNYHPVYYDYYYRFGHLKYLNMRNFYWHRPYYVPKPFPTHRPHHGPGVGRPPMQNRPPQRSHGNGMQNRPPQRSNGNGMQNRPPQRSNGNGMQNRPPQRSHGNGIQNRPPQRSNGNGMQNRPPQRSNGSGHSSQRGGSSSRRR